MRYQTLRDTGIVAFLGLGILGRGGAQPPVVTSTPVVSKSRVVESPAVAGERIVQPSPRSREADIDLEPLLESPVVPPNR